MAGADGETSVPLHRGAMDSQARQSLLMQHQDETLDELGEAVLKVGHMAETINEEIGQQNKMLSEMEEDLEHVEEELGMVMGKLAKVLKTKDRWQLGTIVCLTFTVVLLFLMVLYF
jgi:syntaxin 6